MGLALALVLLTRHVAWNLGFVVLLAYLSYYVSNKSYAAFTAVVTPLILLLINLSRPGDLGVIYNRLIDTAAPAVQRALREPEQRGRSGPAGSIIGDTSRALHVVGEADQALVEYLNWLLRVATGLHEHLAGRNAQVLDSMGELRTRVICELAAVADHLERGQADVQPEPLDLDAELGSVPEAAIRTGEASVVRAFLRRTWQLTQALRLTYVRPYVGGENGEGG